MQYDMKYTLFQSPNGKWGTKDENGNVYDKPVYEQFVKDDGSVIYDNCYDTACYFSEDEGMVLIAWGQPWWENVFCIAYFPKNTINTSSTTFEK